MPSNQIPPPSKISSSLKPLYAELIELNRDHSTIEPNSRRVSFSSLDTPRIKSAEKERVRSGRIRSANLKSVDEGQSEKSSQGQEKKEGKRFGLESELFDDNQFVAELEGKGQRAISSGKSSSGRKSSALDEITSREINHSTPTSKDESNKSSKKVRKYLDADMQTEIGSRNGDEYYDDDSGNEGDVDTYLENISFPESVSRISMIDGPPSREQLQRNQARLMAEHLTQAALLAGAKDNITVMVALLPGSRL